MRILDVLADARHVAVHGYGREGRATVSTLRAWFPDLIVTVVNDTVLDDAVLDDLGSADVVVAHGSPHAVAAGLEGVDAVVRSPGVPLRHDALVGVRAAGTPITTGSNLWFARHVPDNVVAVTGTKGKSTTTSLTSHLLGVVGTGAVAAGNIGRPLLDVDPAAHGVVVVELSSYQLADLEADLPFGVYLNLFDEHVDWHGDHATYHAHKSRIVALSRRLAVNGADERVMERSAGHPDRRVFDARSDVVTLGHRAIDGRLLDEALASSRLVGTHHRHNVAAALTVLATRGVDPVTALGGLATYEPLPHRLQLVLDDGRRWVDDSISTIPASAVAALAAFPATPVTLLLGGYDRQQDHATLVAALVARDDVRVVATGTTGRRFAAEVAGDDRLRVRVVDDLAAAVDAAADETPSGGVVLLSPAAPSYGDFTDFEERGRVFAELARARAGAS